MHRRGRGFGSQVEGNSVVSGDSNQQPHPYYQLGKRRLKESRSQTQKFMSTGGPAQEGQAPPFIK